MLGGKRDTLLCFEFRVLRGCAGSFYRFMGIPYDCPVVGLSRIATVGRWPLHAPELSLQHVRTLRKSTLARG